jgi:enoyl-CoA hydratase
MTYENLLLEFDGPVARLTFNRPKVLNALNRATLTELKAALWEVWTREGCAALILTGSGDKAFVAGADIAEMSAMSPTQAAAFADLGHTVCQTLERIPRVVIAAVNGFALGGGCELSLACDIVLASSNAAFGQPEVRLGIIPGFGGTARLPRAIGKRAAMEWILAGERYPAAEALRLGLVNRVLEPADLLPEAEKLARAIAARGPLAVQAAKRLIHDGLSLPLDAALRTEAVVFANLFDTADQKEGTKAFVEKRPAAFKAL